MSMVKVYIARDSSQAHFVRDLLAREGLRAVVLGDNLQMAIGGVPAVANALPAIWVHPDDQAAAGAVIARMERGGERDRLRAQGPWQCPRCGEMLGPQFTECWNCGASRPSEGAEQVHPPPSSAHEVNLDAPCSRCQYNLRGLTTAQCCPECGRPIVASLMTFLDDQPAEQLPHLNESLRA